MKAALFYKSHLYKVLVKAKRDITSNALTYCFLSLHKRIHLVGQEGRLTCLGKKNTITFQLPVPRQANKKHKKASARSMWHGLGRDSLPSVIPGQTASWTGKDTGLHLVAAFLPTPVCTQGVESFKQGSSLHTILALHFRYRWCRK